jgi:hypothetical protein
MPMHNFSLVGEMFLHCILWIQTSLQIVKRFGKRKGISKSYSMMGRNPGHPGASPAHILSFLRAS